MHLALRNFHSSPPEFLFGISNPGLVGPSTPQHHTRPDRAGFASPPPLRTPASSGAPHPASRPLATLNSPLPPSMDGSRAGPSLDPESNARDPSSAFTNDPSSGSEQRQGSAEAGPSNLASAPGYAQPRRRASRAGTRSVTTLSASQLERKRANDREAQRAIRARTKEHIEKLERRLLELTSQGNQSDQLLASMKRQRELEDENHELRARLQQAHYSLGMPTDSPDTGWASNASILRTPISNGGLPIMSQPQLQTNIPSQARHDSTGSHLAGWQDTGASFGSPTSLRRGGPSPTTYHSDMSSMASGGGARRDTMSPVGPVASAGSSNPVVQAVEYPYRPVVGQQYAPIQETVAQHGQHHISGDSRMSGIHTAGAGIASYGAPAQQHAPAPTPTAAPVQQQQQPQQQQHQQHQHQPQPQSQHSRPQSQSQQTPQYMPYHASPQGGPSHTQQAPQPQGQISHSGFTAQNTPHQQPHHHHQAHQHQHGQPHQEQQHQHRQQQQQQQPLYYNAPGYGH